MNGATDDAMTMTTTAVNEDKKYMTTISQQGCCKY